MQKPSLAIIAGSGDLPILVAEASLKSNQLKVIIVVAEASSWSVSSKSIEGSLVQQGVAVEFLSIIEVDKALSVLKRYNVDSIVFAGKVGRPPLKNLKLKGKAASLLSKLLLQGWRGDDALLKVVTQFFAEEGYKVLPAHHFSESLLAKAGHIAGPALPDKELAKLMPEIRRAKEIGAFDIGQAIVVKDGYVTAVEAAEGTDAMLKRVAMLPEALRGGALIKLSKPKQALEVDLPTIGTETIANCAFSGINTILVEAGKTNIIEVNKVMELAEKHQVTLYGVEVAEEKTEKPKEKKGLKERVRKLFNKMTPEEMEAAIAALPSSELIIIAGEASGDQLGAKLIQELLKTNPDLKVSGVAGPEMRKHETDWFGDIKDLSYFGVFEVLPHLGKIKKFRDLVINQIMIRQPKVVVTIDSPAFSYHIIKKIKLICQGLEIAPPTCIQYVAPSVWAYKESRAQKFAGYFSHLLTLLPFEPQYFNYYGLKTSFIGHPAVELYKQNFPKEHKLGSVSGYGRPQSVCTIGLFPGSRPGELKRHLPILCNMVSLIDKGVPVKFKLIVPKLQVERVSNYLEQHLPKEETRIELVANEGNLVEIASSIDYAIAKSGTIVIELAALGVPIAVFYKLNQCTSILAKIMLKTQWVSLPNILAGKELIPEFLQERATAENLAEQVKEFIEDPAVVREQISGMHEVMNDIGAKDQVTPSAKAAEIVRSYLLAED